MVIAVQSQVAQLPIAQRKAAAELAITPAGLTPPLLQTAQYQVVQRKQAEEFTIGAWLTLP